MHIATGNNTRRRLNHIDHLMRNIWSFYFSIFCYKLRTAFVKLSLKWMRFPFYFTGNVIEA